MASILYIYVVTLTRAITFGGFLGYITYNNQVRVCLLKTYCQTPGLGLRLGVDFTFTSDNNNNNDNHNNPHLNLLKETVPGGKEQGLGIRDKISGIKHKG